MIKRILLFLLLLLIVMVGVLVFNTITAKSKQPKGEKLALVEVNKADAFRHLAQSISYPTISEETFYQDSSFINLHAFLRETYPLVFAKMEFKTIGKHSILLQWKGSDASLEPVLFLGHQDVVPIENEQKWREKPFGGIIKNDTLWGRGAVDDKCTIIALLEACESMIKSGYLPKRTVYLFFGEDEETYGTQGAQKAATYFREQNTRFYAIWDEGGVLSKNIVPGIVDKPVALIGVAEKGLMTVSLTAQMNGGHSSMPEKENAVSIISKAVSTLNENPFPYRLSKPVDGFIEVLGPELPFLERLAFTNATLLSGAILNVYAKKASSKAMIHTTMAPTILKAGVKENVLPARAEAIVNLRILPGETVESCIDYLTKTINDSRVTISVKGEPSNPSAVSNYKSEAFNQLGLAVKDVYPEALVTPFLLIAATDSRYFDGLSENIFKFIPVEFTQEQLGMLHGANEHIEKENFNNAVQVYAQCILRWSNP